MLGGMDEVRSFVEDLYAAGAPLVEVADVWPETIGIRPYADTLVVTLPDAYDAAVAVLVRAARGRAELVDLRDGALELWWD